MVTNLLDKDVWQLWIRMYGMRKTNLITLWKTEIDPKSTHQNESDHDENKSADRL